MITCQCGKKTFPTKKEAKAGVRHSLAAGAAYPSQVNGRRLVAYKCDESDVWHIGHGSAEFREHIRGVK